jgi:hypothetical protein
VDPHTLTSSPEKFIPGVPGAKVAVGDLFDTEAVAIGAVVGAAVVGGAVVGAAVVVGATVVVGGRVVVVFAAVVVVVGATVVVVVGATVVVVVGSATTGRPAGGPATFAAAGGVVATGGDVVVVGLTCALRRAGYLIVCGAIMKSATNAGPRPYT